ncbi:TPA: hypothetical protein ACH3X1_011458 [Trebouxia sp. C0004]
MLTRQLSLCASKRWPFLSLKNLQSCQLTTASTSNTPNLAAGVKRRCAIQAAANSAAESGTPASFVLSAARELADAGVSAAGLATYAEKASRIPFLLRCRILNISGNDANPLADCLLSFGALSVSTEEYAAPGQPEQEVFQDGSGRTWDRCTVTGLFASEHNIAQTLQVVQDVLTITVTQHQIEEVPDQEWVNAMKDSYQPTEVCKGLWIVPDWCETPDPSALNIRMAPGLAFGTGEHSTTRLCLQWLFDRRDKIQGAHVMDYGTGSGVLAVAALLMGAASAVGTDVDPLAVKAAKDNAALNSVGDRLIALQCSASVQVFLLSLSPLLTCSCSPACCSSSSSSSSSSSVPLRCPPSSCCCSGGQLLHALLARASNLSKMGVLFVGSPITMFMIHGLKAKPVD